MHSRRGVELATVVIALTVALTACGGGGGVSRQAFEERLVARNALTRDQAECVVGYVYDGYAEAEIERIHERGIRDLPSARWSEYVLALVGCSLDDELLGTSP